MSDTPDPKKQSNATFYSGLAGVALALGLGGVFLFREALFRLAVERQQWGAAKALLNLDADLANLRGFHGVEKRPVLLVAIDALDDPDFARALLEKGADPSDPELLWTAAEDEKPAMVELLVSHGADPTKAIKSALVWGLPSLIDKLLKAGLDPARSPDALVFVIGRGNEQVVKALLEHGADVWANHPEVLDRLDSPGPSAEIARMVREAAAKHPIPPPSETDFARP